MNTHPAMLEGFHPQDVIALQDPALDELLGMAADLTCRTDPVGIREDNNHRAGRALHALRAYIDRCYGDSAEPIDQGLADLIGDLLHLCDLLNLDFAELEDKARGQYESELEGRY